MFNNSQNSRGGFAFGVLPAQSCLMNSDCDNPQRSEQVSSFCFSSSVSLTVITFLSLCFQLKIYHLQSKNLFSFQGYREEFPELVHTPLGCGFGFWVSKSDARYCCGHTFSPVFAGRPECRFSVPAPEFHRSVAVLAPIKKRLSHSHIPSSRSLSCNRLSGNKKAGTQMRTDYPQKG